MSNKLAYIDDILARAHDVTLEGGAKHRCFDVTLLNELDTVTLQNIVIETSKDVLSDVVNWSRSEKPKKENFHKFGHSIDFDQIEKGVKERRPNEFLQKRSSV